MRIIKQGKPKNIKRFECKECGCVFEAEEREYDVIHTDCYDVYARCKCPCCGDSALESKITGNIAEDYL